MPLRHPHPAHKQLSLLLSQAFAATAATVLNGAEAARAWSSGRGGASAKCAAPASGVGAQMENWYPGHMQQALRDMQSCLKHVDLVLEVRDARVPFSSCSTALEGLLRGKRRLVVLNKADLVPKADLQIALQSIMSRTYLRTLAVSANDPSSVKRVMRASLEVIETERATADESLLMVVGLPNAGKSSIINGLKAAAARSRLLEGEIAHHKKAKTGPLPGVTRALGSFQMSKKPRVFVLDTPGVLPPAIQDPLAALNIALTGGMPMTVTDSSILVKHLVGLLLQNPHKYAQLAKEHLVSMDMETGVGDADDVLAGAGAGKEATGPSQRQCSLQQQQPRQARTHRRAQHLNPSKTQQQQQPRQQADSAAQVQGSQALQPSAHAQPLLGFHKACSSVAKALMEALGPPRHSQLDGLFLQPSAHASPQQGPGAAAGHEVRKPGGPQQAAAGLEEALPDEAHTRMHRLIALLSRDSRRSARGWSRLKCEAAEVPVSAAQRQNACDRVLWALRKGQLGRIMIDDPVGQQ